MSIEQRNLQGRVTGAIEDVLRAERALEESKTSLEQLVGEVENEWLRALRMKREVQQKVGKTQYQRIVHAINKRISDQGHM